MLDIGWQELLVIGVLALLVVGPKELPGLLRTVGQWAGKARSVAREFQRSMEDAAREADLDELNSLRNVKRDVERMGNVNFRDQAKKVQDSIANPPIRKDAAADEVAPPAGSGAEAPDTASEQGGGPAPSAGASGGQGGAVGQEAEPARAADGKS
jgi:sec-independent protein translocase protein TatB